ncbi:zinc finger CCCH domain-containing protein 18-like isoform X1 [Arachis stenosperma]|uniref:zinc finger CCCH domain-containing protein 18-like isoform X1 n=1 Tax=Arachis stenosperma TaxID=217475 RepID=UPI0025AD9A2D|nr:zinc finger CCCH domain-containing protein 18-like isoform X1 [Arachis stenosperma]XP_057726130.1 zinc finger CCCH domain-containing protein 18-like isoform X1 [Arachis stenosperma]
MDISEVMNIPDYTRILFDKLQKFEPEYASKIIGILLLHNEHDIAKLATCPDHIVRDVAFKAKNDLQRMSAHKPSIIPISVPMNPPQGLSHLSVISPRTPTSPPSFPVHNSPYWDPYPATNTNPEFMKYSDSIAELQNQAELYGLESHVDPIGSDFYGLEASTPNFGGKAGRRYSGLSDFPVKTCHYFNKGYCKHGESCRYYHGQAGSESFSHMYGNDFVNDDPVVSPGSLAQLEREIVDLLKQRRRNPITIAALPMAYYDKYKKVLQADGYLTESQRHGKSGYSLTKLLARLSNSICVIDRPHGQHEVVLAEDAPKYTQKRDFVQNISASRQIYLTFPADSTFTEEDVSNYFSTFGCVEDVRIPCQQKRMFGFVTFIDPQTVKTILDKGNPHYVRGSRVLVKPYREKSKVIERKYADRIQHSICYSPHHIDMDSEMNSISRSCGNARSLRRQLMEEQEQALELVEMQRRRLAALQFAQNSLSPSPQFRFSTNGMRASEDHFNFNFHPQESFNDNEKPSNIDTNFSDENSSSQGFDLPDSPFAFPVENENQ